MFSPTSELLSAGIAECFNSAPTKANSLEIGGHDYLFCIFHARLPRSLNHRKQFDLGILASYSPPLETFLTPGHVNLRQMKRRTIEHYEIHIFALPGRWPGHQPATTLSAPFNHSFIVVEWETTHLNRVGRRVGAWPTLPRHGAGGPVITPAEPQRARKAVRRSSRSLR
jgi:hypothetical protein